MKDYFLCDKCNYTMKLKNLYRNTLIFYIRLYAYIENKLTNSQCIRAWKITFIAIICWSRINFLAIIWQAKPFINIKCVKHIRGYTLITSSKTRGGGGLKDPSKKWLYLITSSKTRGGGGLKDPSKRWRNKSIAPHNRKAT